MSGSLVGMIILALLGALALARFAEPGRRSGPRQQESDLGPQAAPATDVRPAHIPARQVVLNEFERREHLKFGAWVRRPGWVEVPDLVAALCCPVDRVVRTSAQARAALAELYQEGLVELELVPAAEALASGHPISLFLPGPQGRYFRWARLVQLELEETAS